MTERKQINWITGLKGIACIGVMLMHFRGAFMMDGTTNAYQLSKGVHFLFEIYILHWPLICSLSAIGFLFFYTKMNTDLLVLLLLAVTVLITILD